MTNSTGAAELPEALRQIALDPENQPNQYGLKFLMHGPKMAFKIGNRQFTLDYEPDEPGEFEFMRDALISAFSIFTHDVKTAQVEALSAAQPVLWAVEVDGKFHGHFCATSQAGAQGIYDNLKYHTAPADLKPMRVVPLAKATQALSAVQAGVPAMPEFDEIDDELIDHACGAGGMYRVDLMRAWGVIRDALSAAPQPSPSPAPAQPIDMVLHCPNCGLQHIDSPEKIDRRLAAIDPPAAWAMDPWKNPPHRSHLCHGCGHIWRPADVPTNGVQAVKTKGKADSPIAASAPAQPGQEGEPAGRFMDEADERKSAKEGYEKRIKRVSERNPHDEGMYSLGWWDRAWKAAEPSTTPQADSVTAPAGGANWAQLRSALAMLMLGWGRNPNQTMDACYRVLDSATEPGTALAILRTAPDWRDFMAADRAKADSVLEDAARLDWIELAGPTSICRVIDRPHDGEVEVATDDVTGYGKTLRAAIDAARKQGGAT